MRYNIALVAKFPQVFIQKAQEEFGLIAKGYLLSSNSMPHITLAQFYVESEDKLANIWEDVLKNVKKVPSPMLTGICFKRKAKDLWGVSLLVEKSKDFLNLHLTIISILQKYAINPVNQAREYYSPHLTLARISKPLLGSLDDSLLDVHPFMIALGESDENGQFVKTLFKKEN